MLDMLLIILLILCIVFRFYYSFQDKGEVSEIECSRVQLNGEEEMQSDALYSNQTGAGMIALAVDGIGHKGIGQACAILAMQSIRDLFLSYSHIDKPAYFLSLALQNAHNRLTQFLDDRYGGASIGCGLIINNQLYYAVVGDVEVWLYRKESLIPLSIGQTLDVLAKNSYLSGKISREVAVRACNEKRVYNYAGQETFHNIELCQSPIRLEEKDLLLFCTKGIKETITENDLIHCLSKQYKSAYEKVSMIADAFSRSSQRDRDNGSVLLVQINRRKGQ